MSIANQNEKAYIENAKACYVSYYKVFQYSFAILHLIRIYQKIYSWNI